VIVWRIASVGHAAVDGEGARLFGSRWTPRGLPAVFASATLSLAALERFVHADPDLEPADLVAIGIRIKSPVRTERVALSVLPSNWRQYPAPVELTSIGERWLRRGKTVALLVPSAVVPRERNVIINPAHRDFDTLTVAQPEPFSYDPRMWKTR
jgi:RES domain-containing protein